MNLFFQWFLKRIVLLYLLETNLQTLGTSYLCKYQELRFAAGFSKLTNRPQSWPGTAPGLETGFPVRRILRRAGSLGGLHPLRGFRPFEPMHPWHRVDNDLHSRSLIIPIHIVGKLTGFRKTIKICEVDRYAAFENKLRSGCAA